MGSGLVAASYPADPGLLDELRAAWPPGPSPLSGAIAARSGSAATDLDGRLPAAAIRLTERFGVALVPDGDEAWRSIPVAGFGGRWWQAAAGDGLSAFVAGVPVASERALDVDQTNASVVVGERVVVKWFRRVGPDLARAGTLLAHLDAVGFEALPQPLGALEWQRDAGRPAVVLAQGDAWLPGARDGWEWAIERLERGERGAGPTETGRQLGSLVAELHRALRTPSAVISTPSGVASGDDVERWAGEARATLATAIELTGAQDDQAGADLLAVEAAITADLDRLMGRANIPTQPVHGDLHVGQVLDWSGGLAVIDFDGNPALGLDANALRQPIERDVAQMLMSLDHVARIAEHRGSASEAAVAGWVHVSRDAFLAAYGPLDPDLLTAFEAEQELRELVYAARFLGRWRYAPLAALRARYRA